MSAELENLRRDIRMRVEYDKMMSTAWLAVYLIPITLIIVRLFLLLIIATFPTMFLGWGKLLLLEILFLWLVLGIISFIVSIVLIYKLVDRRNTHFKRQTFLMEDTIKLLRKIAEEKKTSVETELSLCERTLREARAEETERSAVLWAILSAVIFIATWYVYYFLMKDFYKHERREDEFWEDISKILSKLGISFSPPRRMNPLPNRNFILYLILSIITIGIFGIYWLYVLIKDPNEHFRYHASIDEELFTTLEKAVAAA